MAGHALLYGKKATIEVFSDSLSHLTSTGADQALNRWMKDLKRGQSPSGRHGPGPVYGAAVDELVLR